MPRKKETITLSIPSGTKEKLEEIARRFNIFWGKSPSPSGLIAAIARRDLEVGNPFTFNSLQINSLNEAINALINHGRIEEAQILIELLLERENLDNSLRQSLLKKISQPIETWRKILREQIQKKQPFLLLYLNLQGEEETFTVRWAEIKFFKNEFYLMTWCEETTESEEILALVHNRCFHLDRIINIFSINKIWQKNPDFVLVQLHFFKHWVKNYQERGDDIEDRVNDRIRQVTRKVINTFWLVQEVFKYGEDCEIVSPDSVRERMKLKIQMMTRHYE